MSNTLASLEGAYAEGFSQGIRPTKALSLSVWSEQHRRLSSKASAEPGRWRNSRTPYLVEIMDCLSEESRIHEIYFMKGAQVGATELGLNWIGYTIHHAPSAMMMVQPTVDMAKRASKQRLDPLLEDNKEVFGEVIESARSRDSGNTILSKEFKGGILILTGANSAAGLRSMPVKKLFLDETDAYPENVDEEGSPVDLAKARQRTYARRKLFAPSTPTIHGHSVIEREFERGDMRRYFVPCPHCSEMQYLEWKQLKWEPSRPETAEYECIKCSALISEIEKTNMLALGQWRPTKPVAVSPKIRSYHLSSLYSPLGWYSWRQAASDWEAAKGDQNKLRTFINTVLGETWREKGEAPKWEMLYRRRERYKFGVVPNGAVLLTCGVDVQKDRLECLVLGWGRGQENWVVDHKVFVGETETISPEGPWAKLAELIGEEYLHETGQRIPIRMTGIDSGYNTQAVYKFVRKFSPNRVIATKGSENQNLTIGMPSIVDLNYKGQRSARGARVYPIGISIIKHELFGWFKQEAPIGEDLEKFGYPAGFCHFPQYNEEFFKQICSEQTVPRIVRGYRKYIWEKTRERNEVLDMYVINRAIAALIGVDRYSTTQWQRAESAVGVTAPLTEIKELSVEKTAGAKRQRPKVKIKRKSSGFFS